MLLVWTRARERSFGQILIALFPYWIGPTRLCNQCGCEFDKRIGYRRVGWGWFCSESHFSDFWRWHQGAD